MLNGKMLKLPIWIIHMDGCNTRRSGSNRMRILYQRHTYAYNTNVHSLIKSIWTVVILVSSCHDDNELVIASATATFCDYSFCSYIYCFHYTNASSFINEKKIGA